MRPWANNKIKISGELLSVLVRFKYAGVDKSNGTWIIELTRLQKEQTIQSVASWFKDKSCADLLLGELRTQLEMNGLPPLRDRSETPDDVKRAYGFNEFLKPATIKK